MWTADVAHYIGARSIHLEYPHNPSAIFGEAVKEDVGKYFFTENLSYL